MCTQLKNEQKYKNKNRTKIKVNFKGRTNAQNLLNITMLVFPACTGA